MSVDQYQRTVNSLDKEIADLEKKNAAFEKKAADAQKKATGVSIPKNASTATINSKKRQIASYSAIVTKETANSAEYSKKIAAKKEKRNKAYTQLQKEAQKEQRKQATEAQQIRQSYERQIRELQSMVIPAIPGTDNEPEYDVFVSHAWEDKEDFVDEFVEALTKLGIKVWYDKTQIKWGDSMRKRIDEGLKKSRFGVAVLSPHYIADGKYWTKAELDGLFQLESVGGKMLLPIWHNLKKSEVMAYSPIIASKLAMTTATMTPQEIAEELHKLLNDGKVEDHAQN